MVSSATSLTRNGLTDFITQRVTAAILALYTLWIVGFLLVTPDLDFAAWAGFHAGMPMKLFNTLAVLSIAAHAWIGMWTVGTDYLREAHVGPRATVIRGLYLALCAGALFVFVAWALQLFWGI